jgi:hypothetical protein
MGELKSNKFDTDLLLKCAEVQHDQMKHIAVIVNEAVKTLINTQKQSELEIQNKRINILKQG